MTAPLSDLAGSASPDAPRVLLVDDEALGRRLIRQHLPAGYQVTECPDGESALRAARNGQHDAVLVDVLMPGMDGYEVCRRLKADPLTADLPVIVVTAKSGIEDLEQGFEAGATDYVRKPFNPRELAARVRNAVDLKRHGDSIRRWTERISSDLALAGALQRSLLAPRPFLRDNMRIHTAYRSSIEVGGDFFDIQHLPSGQLALYVGDVAGHGVGAALASTLLKAHLTELVREHLQEGPAAVANELHRRFLHQLRAPGLYATLFLAVVDPEKRHWRCMNCGHPAPIVIAPPGLKRRDFEERGGPPVGFCLAGDTPYRLEDEVYLDLPDEMAVMLVTDGLLEAANHEQPEASTRNRLAELIQDWQQHRRGPPMDHIFSGMAGSGFDLSADDCTALLVEQIPASEVIFFADTPLSAENLTRLADRMELALKAAAWPEASRWAAHLLLVEHGVNVLKHGRAAPGSPLSVHVRRLPESLELMVRDRGQPWTYEEAPALEPGSADDHGRGLLMIRRMASYVASHRHGEENLTLFGLQRDWQLPP